jgi:hypothetical protein
MQAKLRYSSCLFSNEWSRIEFVRDHLVIQAFHIVQWVSSNATSPYAVRSVRELFTLLDDVYSTQSREKELARRTLYSLALKMMEDESFSEWYARFSTALAPVRHTFDKQSQWIALFMQVSPKFSESLISRGGFEELTVDEAAE